MVKYFSMVLDCEVEKTKREIYNLKAKLDCLEVMERLEEKGAQVKIENGEICFFQTLYRTDGMGIRYIYLKSYDKIYRKSWVERSLFLSSKLKDIEAGHIQIAEGVE